jgi:hypothetical protein
MSRKLQGDSAAKPAASARHEHYGGIAWVRGWMGRHDAIIRRIPNEM